MSTMKATGGHSAACCNIPPIVSSGYQKKGDYATIDNRKAYVTGPVDSASKGILVIMDIFGFFDQTIQGADILATADDHQKYAVFMPDAFDGEPLPIDLFPPDNEEKQQKVGAFFGKNSPPSFVPKALSFVKAASAKYPNIKEWGVVGVSSHPVFLQLTEFTTPHWTNKSINARQNRTVLLGLQSYLPHSRLPRKPLQDWRRMPSRHGRRRRRRKDQDPHRHARL